MLDAGVFVEGRAVEGITTPAVAEEVRIPPTIEVRKPSEKCVRVVKEKARETGDLDVLSRADIEVLALALEIGGKVATNDFAVQNVAEALGIEFIPVGKRIRRKIEWEWYCPACGRRYGKKGICEFCGTKLKRRPKSPGRCRKVRD